ncbi:hypothetical protein K491DRAFT_152208 [Lophiostoma macrostomum CBS 122681]|uniref:Alpha/beta hydrolase fold-3 domain-containing protein n=1 Tax=Lophiostoma macrostomum CBS 122681 TaxID=1314788 RepID=A0A6A6TJQ8_9PLEO|nr:hypothetical protein K491DRAFT_152208 [Lophiostoma macrostomum CBS 122681]
MPLTIDPEFYRAAEPLVPVLSSAPKLPVGDVENRRARMAALFANLPPNPAVEGVTIEKYKFASHDGQRIGIYRFSPTNSKSGPGPTILHMHGGGMISGHVELSKDSLAKQVAQTGIQVFSVDYRLAPENPHPVPVEDCYAALLWIQQHREEFEVDLARIAVQGESAGGGLAAGVSLIARDRKLDPPLAKQILVYPMLDDRNRKSIPKDLDVYVMWKSVDNETGWRALLGDAYQTESVSSYAAPARADSVDGLPSTYMDVGSLDIFCDECTMFVARLAAKNVDTEFHVYSGVGHVFEFLAPNIAITQRAVENRLNAIRRL